MSDLIENHNADHPFEFHALTLVEEALGTCNFPTDRIQVQVEFTPTLNTFARHKLDLELLGSVPSGTAVLYFNSLFLMQDPLTFFEQVVHHELAHIFNEVSAFKTGVEVSEHGHEWSDWLERISSTAMPSASIAYSGFDDRAIVLKKGGVLAVCNCESDEAFLAYRNSGEKVAKLRQGEMACQQCGENYRIGGAEEIPISIQSDLNYINQDMKERNT